MKVFKAFKVNVMLRMGLERKGLVSVDSSIYKFNFPL